MDNKDPNYDENFRVYNPNGWSGSQSYFPPGNEDPENSFPPSSVYRGNNGIRISQADDGSVGQPQPNLSMVLHGSWTDPKVTDWTDHSGTSGITSNGLGQTNDFLDDQGQGSYIELQMLSLGNSSSAYRPGWSDPLPLAETNNVLYSSVEECTQQTYSNPPNSAETEDFSTHMPRSGIGSNPNRSSSQSHSPFHGLASSFSGLECGSSHGTHLHPAGAPHHGGSRPHGSKSINETCPTAAASPSEETINCPSCKSTFTGFWRRGNYQRHQNEKHNGKPSGGQICCSSCDKEYKRRDALLKHERSKHPELGRSPPMKRKNNNGVADQ